jgi:DNA-binding CsgD family transcriptional regulator
VKVLVQPPKDSLEAIATEFFSSRSVRTYQLRRAKQRAAARERLRAALVTFENLDADPWAEQARAELQATGATVRRPARRVARRLTPQEFQVARLVADGQSNRDIAAALFLSPKTVEFHLSSIHRKFGSSSRARLVRLLVQQLPF